jgi:spermidine synthase
MSSQSDMIAEESVHYALAQVKSPRRVLLVSAQSGMIAELAKYALDGIDYVELDSDVTEILFRFGIIKSADRLTVIHRDARSYLADSTTVYDAILVNLTDPETFQTNRFFTDRFFELARRRLTDQGVLSFSMEGFENYLSEPQRQKLSSLFNTVTLHFRHVLMLPGQRVYFICSDRPLQSNIVQILAAREIPTLYISAYFDGDVTPERISRLKSLLDPDAPLNAELVPYLMQTVFSEWFFKFETSPVWFIAVVSALLLFYFLRVRRLEFILFSTGWMVMGSEILIIFAFQIFFGYIYLQIGIIVTVFLAGMLPGAWVGRKLIRRASRVLMLADMALIGMLVVVLAGVHIGDRLPAFSYLAMGFAISLVCGLQFPAALHLRADTGAAATGMFSADLIGAAFGTLVTSTVLIPYLGILGAVGGLMALKLVSLWMTVPLHEGSIAKTVSG